MGKIMGTVIMIASYISKRYKQQFGKRIDEMKLHKLLYFVQRECIVQTGEPMFVESFQAWRYGPVMQEIRHRYQDDTLNEELPASVEEEYKSVFDTLFDIYAPKKSWSLSSLSHGEYSWRKAREGYGPMDVCHVCIATDDIRKDAERIRIRRFLLAKMQNAEVKRS